MGRGHRPNTEEQLREFLRERCSDLRLLRVAGADHARDAQGLARAFRSALEMGVFFYNGKGNAYECALMQRHDQTADRPLNELFGAWWLGAFCWEQPVLLGNLGVHGVGEVLAMLVRGCSGLGEDAARAAHAALPFVDFVHAHDEEPVDFVYDKAIGALEAIERHGAAGVKTTRYQDFLNLIA